MLIFQLHVRNEEFYIGIMIIICIWFGKMKERLIVSKFYYDQSKTIIWKIKCFMILLLKIRMGNKIVKVNLQWFLRIYNKISLLRTPMWLSWIY